MQCLEIQDLLSPYLDGVLNSSEGEEISAHLAACPNCRAEFEILCELVDALKALPELSPSPEFSAQILKNVSNLPPAAGKSRPLGASPGSFTRGSWSRVVALAAALVFTVSMTVLMYGMPGKRENVNQLFQTLIDQGQTDRGVILSDRDKEVADDHPNNDSNAGSGLESQHYADIADITAPGSVAPISGMNSTLLPAPGPAYSSSPGGEIISSEPLNNVPSNQENFKDSTPGSIIPQVMAVKEGNISRNVAYGNVPASIQDSAQKIIHTTSLHLDAGYDVQSKIKDLARSNGGQLSGYSGGGVLVMKVPVGQYENVVNSIQDLGQMTLSKMNREDVSKEYTVYETRLKELALNEQILLVALEKPGPSPASDTQAQLKEVREDLEYQKKQLTNLSSLVEYSTIELRLD